LTDFLSFAIDEAALARLSWRDFGNGLSMARLARKDQAELVLYRIAATAAADAFLKHEHLGGELYLVLKGGIADETGVYEQGELVFLAPQSVHTPRAMGETIVLVFWPGGVRIVE
jgi:putative transcriptional regulator